MGLPVGFSDLVIGSKIELPHIDGKSLTVKIDAGSELQDTIEIREGVYLFREFKKGFGNGRVKIGHAKKTNQRTEEDIIYGSYSGQIQRESRTGLGESYREEGNPSLTMIRTLWALKLMAHSSRPDISALYLKDYPLLKSSRISLQALLYRGKYLAFTNIRRIYSVNFNIRTSGSSDLILLAPLLFECPDSNDKETSIVGRQAQISICSVYTWSGLPTLCTLPSFSQFP